MKTNIFHITYYDNDKSVYIQFIGCNFRCIGCIRRSFKWDHHLPNDELTSLNKPGIKTLSLEDLEKLLRDVKDSLGLEKAVLGGGEPTVDPAFCKIIKLLSNLNLNVAILTNGYRLGELMEYIPRNCLIELSIKSIDPMKFFTYTGRDLETVLNNFKLILKYGINIIVETILIPGFNDPADIEKLAAYISSYSNDIPLIIDEYIPVPNAPWRRPIVEELRETKELTQKYLKNVIIRSSYPEFKMKPLGKVRLIYPTQMDR
jgi:pyruvate-formate lyase-activating enzyme